MIKKSLEILLGLSCPNILKKKGENGFGSTLLSMMRHEPSGIGEHDLHVESNL